MQKIINGIAIASGAISIALVGTVGVVYLNKDAIIDNIKKQAIEAVTGGMGGALTGDVGLPSPQAEASLPKGTSMGLPVPGGF
jgi:hypothetical protein|tara:strand:- start:1517 stop:1765 length:249 start_codon:yes stop_codon:yes gene_type:complete